MTKIGAQVFTVILVTILLYYSEKCNSQPEDAFVSNIYNRVRGFKHNFPTYPLNKRALLKSTPSLHQHHVLSPPRLTLRERFQALFKKLKNSENPTKVSNTPQSPHRVLQRRLARQAYPEYRPALYPSLPTPPPSYHHQPYNNHNYLQPNQTNYTLPYNSQWQPTSTQNYSQPGYPGYTPSNDNGFNTPGYPSSYNSNYPPYKPRPSAPVSPNPGDNPHFGHGHGHRYPYTTPTNFTNVGPQNPPGYQPYPGSSNVNNHPTPRYPPSHGTPNNTYTYNPSQRPPYYRPGNSTVRPNTQNYPPYSTTQRYPVAFYNDTTQRNPYKYPDQFGRYNNSQSGSFNNRSGFPGYPDRTPQSASHGPYNSGQSFPNHNYPGFGSNQLNSTAGFPGTHQPVPSNASFYGYRPNNNVLNPSHPYNNNFTNPYNLKPSQVNYPYSYNLTKPNSNTGAGYNGYNSFASYNPNQGTYPQTNYQLPGAGFYPQPQYNGTSTYRIADHYTPNIPNQPPRKENVGQHSFYSPSATDDPTRVPPERFSY